MRKILVIGPGGAGKSTLSTRLGEILGLDVVHLDSLYWRPGWAEPPKHEWAATVDEIVGRESWIVDGNYSGTLERRLEACDTVVFLDLPRLTCVWRATRRVLKYRNTTRPDMAEGCPERFSLEFLLWIWNYPTRTRPRILRRLRASETGVRVFRLESQAQIERFLEHARDPDLVVAADRSKKMG